MKIIYILIKREENLIILEVLSQSKYRLFMKVGLWPVFIVDFYI